MRNFKKFLSLLLVFVMLCGMLVVPASAAATETITVQLTGKDGQTTTLATWTYDSENETYTDNATNAKLAIVTDYSSNPLVYTGMNKKPDPRCLSVTTKGIALEDLYDYAEKLAGNIDLRGDTAMYLAQGTFADEFTYDQYWGLTRYNYMKWYNQESYASDFSDWSDGVEVAGTLAIKGYHATTGSAVNTLVANADSGNALRISVGQQKDGNKTIADSWVHTGSNGGKGDINEGNLSVKNIDTIKFTPVYRTITVTNGAATGTEGVEGYSVAVTNATVTTDDNWFKAAKDEKVTLTVTAATGYEVKSVAVAGTETVAVTDNENGTYSFTMPGEAVTVAVETEAAAAAQSPVTMTAGAIVDGKFDLTITVDGEPCTGAAMAVVTVNLSAEGLSLGSEFSARQGSAALGSNEYSYQFVSSTGKHQYTLSANSPTGEDLVMVIPVTVADNAQPGTYTITMEPAQTVMQESCYGMFMGSNYMPTALYPEVGTVTTTVTVEAAAQPVAPSTITTAAELKLLADEVNAGDNKAGKTYTLGADIDLSDYTNWTPIGQATVDAEGNLTLDNAFAGTFDGNDKTISGLSASNANGGVALFGYSTGTIKDLTVSGTVSGNLYTAGVVAVGQGTISGVTSNVNVTLGASGQYAGGILGEANGTISITDCHNTGTLTNGGGSADISTGRVGGIVGRVDTGISATITNCSNTGAITAYQYVGGIIGGAFGNVEIKGCYNSGPLTAISFGKNYLGGIAGKLQGGTIDSCYNVGTLNSTPWGNGHIRAVGGIAGCEEDHAAGTAITNCYNVGTINLDTSKMQSGKNIYLVGAISGGNNSDGNTMGYEDCFYLAGCIPSQDPTHASYQWWNDSWKANTALYDTAKVLAKSADELKSDEVLAALGDSFKAVEGGYPVLTWQDGTAVTPTLQSYAVTGSVTGGSATVDVAATAQEQSTVSFTVTGIESGKQIKSVTVTDAAGANVPVSENEGTYSFTMPSRAVTIAVTLENVVAEDAESYAITLPTGLDAIWNITVNSTQYDAAAGKAQKGASVTIVVNKDEKALGTSFTGITVTGASGNVDVTAGNVKDRNGSNYYGEYTFTMPGEAVEVTLNATYADLEVYVKEGGKDAELKKTLTRADMVTLSAENNDTAYYSGWRTETEAFIGVAEQYVTLTQLLTNAGITLEEGDSVTVSTPDNFALTYTYEQLTAERKYYSDILTRGANATEGTDFPYTLVIKGNTVTDANALGTVVCDTLYTYRFVYGQTTTELTGKVKCVDSMPQCVTSVTVNKAEKTTTGWDGTADTSWYNDTDTTFIITTAAQLAGLAQLVDEGNDFSGKTVLLGNDIALNEEDSTANNWNPIGSAALLEVDSGVKDTWGGSGNVMVYTVKDGSKAFAGTFDGQNYKITGLYINSSEQGQGLFAYNSGTIKNLTVNGTIAKAGSDYIGSIAGFNSGTIADVTSNVTITVGGSYNVGGIVGYNDGYFGGAQILRCTNNGDVTALQALGGIAGENAGKICWCVNNGNITSTTTNGHEGTGGIVGRAGNNYTSVTVSVIEYCYNTGTIDGNKWVGGVAGFNTAKSTVRNSYNIGSVSGYGQTNPIVGKNEAEQAQGGGVIDCYSLTSLKGYDTTGVFGGYQVNCVLTDEATLKAVPAELAIAFVAGGEMNDGYPVLFWEKGLTMGTITVDKDIDFGTVTCEAISAAETNTVTVTVKAEKNYALAEGSLKYTTDGETYTELTATSTEGEYTFTMPKGDVTITAEFTYTGTYWDGTTINTAWYNTTDTVFIINTPAELAGFAAIVNGTATGIAQDDFAGKTVQLGTNIALGQDGLYESKENVRYQGSGFGMTATQYYLKEAAPVWTPIGSGNATSNTNASGNAFAGTFDGKGYTVTGVYTGTKDSAAANTATVQGLFGIVTGTVKNLTVSGCITGKMVLGGVVAHLNGGTIENCTNKAIVFGDGGRAPSIDNGDPCDGFGAVGGIVGNVMTGSSVTKCMNQGTVTFTDYSKGGRVGGIIGLIDSSSAVVTINQCGNTGEIVGYQYVAGIVGMNYSTKATVDRCYNAGEITAWSAQKAYAAGIVGMYNCVISNCYNVGNIVFKDSDLYSAYSGGIAGAYGNSNQTMINCYNLGTLNGVGNLRYLGMIVGGSGKASNCYYSEVAKSGSNSACGAGGGTSKTEAELKDAAFLTAINVDNMGAFVSDSSTDPVNNGYPVLGWQLGVADPIPVSTKYEGKFKSEYIENQKFSIGDFKLYTVYNNDSTTALNEYEVYLGEEKLDTAAYTFTQEDNGKTLKVTWTANGTEVNYVEKALAITADSLNGSFAGNSGSPKLGTYFAGETLNVSALTKVMYYLTSGGRMTVEGEKLANLKWSLKVGEETVLTFNADFTNELTVNHNGAKLIMSYTWREKTVDKDWGALTVLENKDPNEAGYYVLSTADDVVWFSAKVASGVTNINAILMNDIDLTGVSLSTVSNYAGTFDGNGKTLTIKDALFNSITTGTVKNLTVAGAISGSGKGGIVNSIKGAAIIENCTNKASITANTWNNPNNTGGVVGNITADASGAKIVNCINEGAITISSGKTNNVGGIVGNADCADVEISNCVNKANVSAGGYNSLNVGGIAGASKAKIINCGNTGNVKNERGNVVGGIVGNNSGSITGCFNTGSVTVNTTFSGQDVGGIAGINSGSITDCYNTGTINTSDVMGKKSGGIAGTNSGTVVNCYNTGSLSGNSSGTGTEFGAIAGTNSGTITNSYALEGTNSVLANGSGTVTDSGFKTSDELKVADLGEAWVLHGASTLNSGYPILAWQRAGVLSDWTVSITDDVEGTAIVTPGTNVTMQVKVSGKAFNNVEATVTYDASVFDYVICADKVDGMTVTKGEDGKITLVLMSNGQIADGTVIASLLFQARMDQVTGSGAFTFENSVVHDAVSAQSGNLPAALAIDTVKVAEKYDVTLPTDGGLTGETYAYAGEGYTGQIANYDGENYDYTISVNGEKVSAAIEEDGSFTIAASDITDDAEITVSKTLTGMTTAVVADYVNGYTMILVEKSADNTSTTGYTYDGKAMFYVEAYGAYAWIVSGAIAAEDAAVLVAVNSGETITIAKDNYNVNSVDGVDFADASVAFFCANVNQDYPMDTMMVYYLCADVNGDKVVDSDDVADIMASANYNQ